MGDWISKYFSRGFAAEHRRIDDCRQQDEAHF
jgi:hypothetical protein